VTDGHVILVSDTHLSQRAPQAQANWDAVLRYVTDTAPRAVIHLGDLSLDGAHEPTDLEYARRQLDRLPVPWHVIPGNHDVGENQWPGVPGDHVQDDRLRQRWLDVIGPDWWAARAGAWTLLGINAQLAATGLAAEAEQWAWLREQLRELGGQPVALLTHKPLGPEAADGAGAAPPFRFWTDEGRWRLAGALGDRLPDLVVSGHVHQYRELRIMDTDQLWVPTTWAVLPDDRQPVLGAKRCGVIALDLTAGPPARPVLAEPPGITQYTLYQDVPDPYRH
jgi:3',5'-cyclic AMP phosphodiesterase CpdA